MKKVNITIGRFQPFTAGHLQMILDGRMPCIVYRINSSKNDESEQIKVGGKSVKSQNIKNVLEYIESGCETIINEIEKEILKRPFSNKLVEKELDIVKKYYKEYFEDVIYVNNAYEALADFAKKVCDGIYEPGYLMCGDDRIDTYTRLINVNKTWKHTDGKEYDNSLKSKLLPNTGTGRTGGISGTDVRKSIIKKDKQTFTRIMPKGTDVLFNDFVNAFDKFKKLLLSTVNESYKGDLREFIYERLEYVNEGGAGGHMSHPIDYTDFTCEDLIDLVENLFSGKIESMKEKLDGMNINASLNERGEVVFIRNNSERNLPEGGISIKDMETKWEGKDHQLKVYIQSGKIIEQIFNKIDAKYFNPEPGIRKIINCECIIEGKTNVIPYAKDRVAFHGYKLYKLTDKLDKNGNKSWAEIDEVEGDVDLIYKAAEGIDAAKPRPNLIVKSVEDGKKFAEQFKKSIIKLFSDENLKTSNTIEDWKFSRFEKIKPEWLDKNVKDVFNRWFNKDKSFKANDIKKLYPEHYELIKSDSFADAFIKKVMSPLDILFLNLGNEFIKLCDGFINQESHNKIVSILKKDMEDVISNIGKNGSDKHREKLQQQLNRLYELGEQSINSTEGIVFVYKNKLMKLTGSFAPLNSILGIMKF